MLQTSIVVEFIKVIPSSWTLRTGMLEAPYKLINDGGALNYTKFQFGSSVNQMICGIGRVQPSIIRALLYKKLPGQVEFGDSSCFGQCEVLSSVERIEAACYFIEADYSGRLKFAEGGEDGAETPEKICEIFLPREKSLGLASFEINMNDTVNPDWAFEILKFAGKCLQPLELPVNC